MVFTLIKVAISEFELMMLMFVLLNHNMFIELMMYLKMHLKTHFFIDKQK